MAFTKLEPTGVNTSASFTFANANVTGNLTVNNTASLGPVANVIITGGTNGQVLSTDGSGSLSWVDQSGGGSGSNYSNANVALYLPTYTGNFTLGNANASGNITATYFIGNGSQLTGLPESYSNTNVAAYLPTYTGNFTLGNANASGNITATYFSGNASLLTSVTGANVTGTVANATYATTSGSATTAATVTTAAQPNITSVGSLSGITVSNVTGIIDFTTTANVTLGSVGNLHISGGTSGYVLSTDGSGALSWISPPASSSYSNSNVASYLLTNTGNIGANFFLGNGSLLSSITGANVTGTVANATYAVSAGSATTAATVTTAAQPNITSVGSLNGLVATSTVDLTGSSNVALGPIANVHIAGGTTGQYLQTDGSGTLSWATVSGGGSNIANGTSNVNIASSGGNVTASVGGNANVVVITGTGANVNGYLSITGAITTGGGTGGTFSGANLISANFFSGDGSLLTGLPAGYANSNVAAYLPTYTGQMANSLVAGTVYTNAQPNITSVGTLASLTVTGLVTATAGGIKVGNLQDTSGTNTVQLLNSNMLVTGNISAGAGGTGNVTATYFIGNGSQLTGISAGGGSSISNGTSNLNIPASGGNINASVGGNANIVVVTGTGANVNGYLTITGALSTGGGGGGTISGANVMSANYFIGNGALLTGISGGGGSSTSITNGTSNVNIGSANANVTVGVGGTSNVAVFSTTGANISGNLTVSGVLYAGAGTGGSIAGANSISANYFVGKRYAETVVSGGTTSGTLTPDVNLGTIFQYTLNGATTISALGNAVAGTSVTLILTQDATGTRLLTSTMKFAGGSKTLTTTAGAIDIMSVFYDGTTYYAALSKGYA